MRIAINNCRYTPTWETLQKTIRELLNDDSATIIRISRKDGGVDYRGPGDYEVDIRRDNGTVITSDMSFKAENENIDSRLIIDALHAISSREVADKQYTKGLTIGIITGLMACGHTWESAADIALYCLPSDYREDRLPGNVVTHKMTR